MGAIYFIVHLIFVRPFKEDPKKFYSTEKLDKKIVSNIHFEDVTQKWNIVYNHLKNTQNENQFKGYVFPSVTIYDFDKNGFADIFYSGGDRNYLYLNMGNGKFIESASDFGIACDHDSDFLNSQAVMGDFNGDGEDDIYLATSGRHRLFYREKNKNHFLEVSEKLNGYSSFSHGINLVDFNQDGKLDVVVANFHEIGKEYRQMKFIVRKDQVSDYGTHNHLLVQDQAGNFIKTNLSGRKAFTNAVGISDINLDGFPDIFFANDYGADQLLLNIQGKLFEDLTNKMIPKDSILNGGKNAEFADYNQDGLIDLFVTNAYIPPYQPGFNMLWNKKKDNLGFELVSSEQNIGKSGLSWGAKFADFNMDGKLDLYVANGLSRDVRADNIKKERSTWFEKNEFGLIPVILRFNKKSFETESELLYQRFGFERDSLFIQGDHGKFYDVADDIGLTDDSEGRGLAIADLNNDGRMDVIVTNFLEDSKVYINQSKPSTSWIGFTLHTEKGSLLPIGAKIILRQTSGPDLVKEFYPANGFRSQSDHRVLYTLAPGSKFKELEIKWPSKKIKTYKSLEEIKYNDVYEK